MALSWREAALGSLKPEHQSEVLQKQLRNERRMPYPSDIAPQISVNKSVNCEKRNRVRDRFLHSSNRKSRMAALGLFSLLREA